MNTIPGPTGAARALGPFGAGLARWPRDVSQASGDASDAPLGLYVHIPFCAQKCPYCDFNTYAGLEGLFGDYIDALCLEMARWSPVIGTRPVATVFIGGGTPTVLPLPLLERLFASLRRCFALSTDCEISCEANPGTVDQAKFAGLRALGVNRLSLGGQSFQPRELRFLGRIHDADDLLRAFDAARAAGFDNINVDFIFGLPGQSPASWQATLEQAVALAPEHLSLYSLIVEPGTPLHEWVARGQVTPASEDEAAGHYELAMVCLAQAGYRHYEVSNWARVDGPTDADVTPVRACRHNLTYWRNQEYLGLGPGAHSHLRLINAPGQRVSHRWSNLKPVPGYIRRMSANLPVEAERETLDERLGMAETMMLGLRLIDEGVPLAHFRALHGRDLGTVFAPELAELAGWELIDPAQDRVRLTPRGLMVANQVCAAFMPD